MPYLLNEDAAASLIRDALGRYGIPADEAHLELIKYRENFVYRVRHKDIDYAVRLHRPGHRSDDEIRAELQLLASAAASGLIVPAVTPTQDGDLLCSINKPLGGPFQIDAQEWIAGSRPFGSIEEGFAGTSTLTPVDFRRLGHAIGRLHNVTARMDKQASAVRGAWNAEGLAGENPLWGDPLAIPELGEEGREILKEALEKLLSDLRRFGTAPDGYGIIHADFTPENVLVKDSDLVLIDFDDYGQGWYLFDLVTTVFFFLPHPRFEEYVGALLTGYRSERELPEPHMELWQAFLFARATTYLGWAGERRGDPDAEFIVNDLVPLALRLAAEYLDKSPASDGQPMPPVSAASALGQ